DGRQYIAVAAATSMDCGIAVGGNAYCWGSGYLGNGVLDPQYYEADTPIAVVGGHTFTSISAALSACAITTDRLAYCWGPPQAGNFGDGSDTARNVPTEIQGGLVLKAVDVHRVHACAMALSGQPYCWGDNFYEELGVSAFSTRATTSPIPVPWAAGVPGIAVAVVAQTSVSQTGTAGAAAAISPGVLVLDYAGKPVVGQSVTFAVTAGGGSIERQTAVTDSTGVASAGTWTLGAAAGLNEVTATVVDVGLVLFTATGN
ncbi:MAG TPA: hypothetical protein VIJ16_00735, partial [Gemmatimonadaceae bacterium]